MEVQELKVLIKNRNIPHFLIFAGDEWVVQKRYIKQIAVVTDMEVKYIDKVTDIGNSLISKSLFTSNNVYVIRDDKEFMTEEKLQQKTLNNLGDNILILELTNPDKRLKLLKAYKDNFVEFKAITDTMLQTYIQKEIDLNDRNCRQLMSICENNYGRCLLEIDKIRNCMGATKAEDMPNNIFEMLVADGTIYCPPKEALWDFIKAVLQNRPKLAFDLWYDLKKLEAPTLSILSNLYNNTKQLLQVQTCESNDVAKTTGLTGWQIKNAKECVGSWRAGDLVYLMRLIQRVESGIKAGKIEETLAIDYVLTSFF